MTGKRASQSGVDPKMNTRLRRRLWFYGGLAALLCGGCYAVTAMPGTSFRGRLAPATKELLDLQSRLERHVRALAVTVGERRLGHGDSLERSRTYLSRALGDFDTVQSARVEFEQLTGPGAGASNVILELRGTSNELVVVGAHYDTAPGTPGANDTPPGSPQPWSWHGAWVRAATTAPCASCSLPTRNLRSFSSRAWARSLTPKRVARAATVSRRSWRSSRWGTIRRRPARSSIPRWSVGSTPIKATSSVSSATCASEAWCGAPSGSFARRAHPVGRRGPACVRAGRGLVRSLVVLASRLPCHHGDGHRHLSSPELSRGHGRTGGTRHAAPRARDPGPGTCD